MPEERTYPPNHLAAEGDSPIFAANKALSTRETFSAAKIGTVPRERLQNGTPIAKQ